MPRTAIPRLGRWPLAALRRRGARSDAVWIHAAIGQAVQLNHQGEREAARLEFEAIGDEIGGEQGDPLHVCTLAHAMADARDDLREELLWDLRALSAADLLTDARMTQAGVGLPAGGLYPSLHLNLSECYRKLGDLGRVREHFERAEATVGALGDDEYGRAATRSVLIR